MTKKKKFLFIIVPVLLSILFAGCSKDSYTEEKENEDYTLNKQNSLRLFSPVMFNNSDDGREELFKIVHISDAHVSAWSRGNNYKNPQNLKEAVQFANEPATRINVMVATGDHISNHHNTTRDEAIEYMTKFTGALYQNNKIPTLVSSGNHDVNMLNSNYSTFALNKSGLYQHMTSKINYVVRTEGIENYYYADLANPMGGVVRIIALDVTDQDVLTYETQHYAIFSQKQVNWLCNEALKKDMTAYHSVIILIHHPLPPYDEDIRKFILNSTRFLYNWNMLPEIVEAFRAKQSLTKKYHNNKSPHTDSISVDVSFLNSPGEFICYLGGHLHTYLNYEVNVNQKISLPKQIMIIANNMSSSEKSDSSPIERTDTGLQNNTFNLYAIDTKRKMIYIAFFGATSYYYSRVLALPYL